MADNNIENGIAILTMTGACKSDWGDDSNWKLGNKHKNERCSYSLAVDMSIIGRFEATFEDNYYDVVFDNGEALYGISGMHLDEII